MAFAGNFVSVPHMYIHGEKGTKMKTKARLRLGITELLDDMHLDEEEEVMVTLVPRAVKPPIGGIKIEYMD
ncbi:hypothetical protein MLD38_036739 [Melastoma candidum]|uniref:Uncharacterized protein n=1 Tax=Melastoma candidum TaxID=119954 RepID=A0ACB9LKK9_9MYRT|nr:hypothetical protein MLD38_036739 [Melastoma candidum]